MRKLSPGHGHGHIKGQNRSLFNFWTKNFSVKDILGIIVRRSPPREDRLWLGSVAAALVDSPQQYVDSTWGETCLILLCLSVCLLTVWSCLFIPMFCELCCPCEWNVRRIINNFTETLCDVDDWSFHSLSLCLSPFSVYYLCHFVTVCTVKRMWVGGCVTVIFHILSIRKHWF